MLPIWSDGLGYYSYLPSYLIYHDLSMESLYEPTRHYDYPSQGLDLHPGEGFLRHPATGRYLIKYPLGTAALEFPFFLLGHLAAPFLGSTPDGFSWPYQAAMDTATTVYMLLGLIFLFKLLSEYFSSRIVLITLLSLYLGTNFLAYVAVESSLSHAYSFCLVCLFLWLVPRWSGRSLPGNSALLGLVCGMIPLVRNTNATFAPFFAALRSNRLGGTQRKGTFPLAGEKAGSAFGGRGRPGLFPPGDHLEAGHRPVFRAAPIPIPSNIFIFFPPKY